MVGVSVTSWSNQPMSRSQGENIVGILCSNSVRRACNQCQPEIGVLLA
jgi:hypothetical protein